MIASGCTFRAMHFSGSLVPACPNKMPGPFEDGGGSSEPRCGLAKGTGKSGWNSQNSSTCVWNVVNSRGGGVSLCEMKEKGPCPPPPFPLPPSLTPTFGV